jgi:2-phospho-L-lactate/phosphoenolpyruvate guanylyltransferase
MNARAIVPQKALSTAKSRLGASLGPKQRIELSLALLRIVCGALRAAPGIERVTVMTPDPAVGGRVGAWGVAVVPDPGPGLNAALARMITRVGRSAACLIIAGDLPLLSAADVASLLAAGGSRTLVLAPSKEGTGTNAVLIPAGMPFRPAYGPGSLRRHRLGAQLLGYEAVEVRRPGLTFDVDGAADLEMLRGVWERVI